MSKVINLSRGAFSEPSSRAALKRTVTPCRLLRGDIPQGLLHLIALEYSFHMHIFTGCIHCRTNSLETELCCFCLGGCSLVLQFHGCCLVVFICSLTVFGVIR